MESLRGGRLVGGQLFPPSSRRKKGAGLTTIFLKESLSLLRMRGAGRKALTQRREQGERVPSIIYY